MDNIITDLEKGLTEQLANLTKEIRNGEETLLRNKEGYLKVQGALELLGVIKKHEQQKEEEALKEALTGTGVD